MTDALDRAVEEAFQELRRRVQFYGEDTREGWNHPEITEARRDLEAAIAARACRPLVEALEEVRVLANPWAGPIRHNINKRIDAALAAYRGTT